MTETSWNLVFAVGFTMTAFGLYWYAIAEKNPLIKRFDYIFAMCSLYAGAYSFLLFHQKTNPQGLTWEPVVFMLITCGGFGLFYTSYRIASPRLHQFSYMLMGLSAVAGIATLLDGFKRPFVP